MKVITKDETWQLAEKLVRADVCLGVTDLVLQCARHGYAAALSVADRELDGILSWSEPDPDHGKGCDCDRCLDDDQPYMGVDALEFWVVSEWLAKDLIAHGERVLDTNIGSVWARTCSGQAIYADGVIQSIAVEREIRARKMTGEYYSD